jgi:hypothetical protein
LPAEGEVEQLPLLHIVLVVHPPVLLASFATHWPPLQYCALQAVDCPAPQAPDPLQVAVIFAVKSLEQLDGQETSLPGDTQSACVPSHFMVPQVPEPPQELRSEVTAFTDRGVIRRALTRVAPAST